MALVLNSQTTAFDAARELELNTTDFLEAVRRLSAGLRYTGAAADTGQPASGVDRRDHDSTARGC